MPPLILLFAIAAWTWVYFYHVPLRVAFLRSLITLGVAAVLITELLSPWHALDPVNVFVCWLLVLVSAPLCRRLFPPAGHSHFRLPRPSLFEAACVVAIAGMAGLIAYTAVISPPNSADAMAYHLPRVIYWTQQRSVAFFPTSHLNQIMLQPVTEYMALQAYLLSGSDRFTNLLQFGGYLGSIVAVSSIAESLELDRRTQAIAALFCATLPNAILQASGAKNDVICSFWHACVVLFALRWLRGRSRADLVFLAFSTALVLGTKGTAYLFVPGLLAAAILAGGYLRKPRIRQCVTAGLALGAATLLINGPQYYRNYELSGSMLGFDSAQADGFFRWRNEDPGWRPTVSNFLRNTSEQLGARSESWNNLVYAAVIGLHRSLAIDPQDPGTTWRWAEFRPPRNSNHEADANNRWHLLLLAAAMVFAAWKAAQGDRRWIFYSAGPALGFLAFCFYLKWQPFSSRLIVPLFIVSAPLGAMAISRLRFSLLQALICLLLVSNSRLALIQNWTRPLTGTVNLRNTPRQLSYFNDMAQWNNRESYLTAVNLTAAAGCELVGIDISRNHVEYPFQALLREKIPVVRFLHTGVDNPSAKYEPANQGHPCAVLCLDCAGVEEKMSKYGPVGSVHTIGLFLLFLPT